MLLADNIPEAARTCYLALKATIKAHINNELDDKGYEHKFTSYWLKSILFFEVEKRKVEYWDESNVEAEFFHIILQAVIDTVKKGMWNFSTERTKDSSSSYVNMNIGTEMKTTEKKKKKGEERKKEKKFRNVRNEFRNETMESEELGKPETIEEKKKIVCPHFWIKNVDLMIDIQEEDFKFWDTKLKEIKDDTKKYVTSEWLEWNR